MVNQEVWEWAKLFFINQRLCLLTVYLTKKMANLDKLIELNSLEK